jgi:Cu/Zn superoxide dismutase
MKKLLPLILLAGCTTGSSGTPAVTATAEIAPFGTGTVTGTATFTEVAGGVNLAITLSGCVAGKSYPVHIHEGAACTDATTQGGHWAVPRGEGIPSIVCSDTTGTTTMVRMATPAESAWTIGGDITTDVEGHVLVVHDPDVPASPPRIGCGVIAAE